LRAALAYNMRLLTNIISVGFLTNGVEALSAALVRGRVGLGNSSHSKIGGPGRSFRYAVHRIFTTRRLTAQLIIVTLASVDVDENGAIEQKVDHYAFSRLAQQSQQLWPWFLFHSSDSFIEVEAA
jgi:hypothetical protein